MVVTTGVSSRRGSQVVGSSSSEGRPYSIAVIMVVNGRANTLCARQRTLVYPWQPLVGVPYMLLYDHTRPSQDLLECRDYQGHIKKTSQSIPCKFS